MDWPTTKDTSRVRLNYVVLLLFAALLAIVHFAPPISLWFFDRPIEGLHPGPGASLLIQYAPALLLVSTTLLITLIALLKWSSHAPNRIWWVVLAAASAIISRHEIILLSGAFVRAVAPYMNFDPDKWLSFLNLMG
jgi:hypothetical protein